MIDKNTIREIAFEPPLHCGVRAPLYKWMLDFAENGEADFICPKCGTVVRRYVSLRDGVMREEIEAPRGRA